MSDRRGDYYKRDREYSRDEDRRDKRPREENRRRHDFRSRNQQRRSVSRDRGIGNLRIDRHECRRAAIEFLIHNYNISETSWVVLEPLVNSYIRTLDMDADYYTFTVEILKGLLVDRKYIVICDRWIMGILDEHLQAELRVPDLSILRVAGFELLTHPEIPTTVIINEVNVLSKMYCPEKQSLIHAAVNRMIETQLSIGIEVQNNGESKKLDNPLSGLIGLDQEAQLALILLRRNKHSKITHTEEEKPQKNETNEESESPFPPVPKSRKLGDFKIQYLKKPEPLVKRAASTQTVRDPMLEPGVSIYKITM